MNSTVKLEWTNYICQKTTPVCWSWIVYMTSDLFLDESIRTITHATLIIIYHGRGVSNVGPALPARDSVGARFLNISCCWTWLIPANQTRCSLTCISVYYSLLRHKAATVKHRPTNITIHSAMQYMPKISQTINTKHPECQIHVKNAQYCKNTKTISTGECLVHSFGATFNLF